MILSESSEGVTCFTSGPKPAHSGVSQNASAPQIPAFSSGWIDRDYSATGRSCETWRKPVEIKASPSSGIVAGSGVGRTEINRLDSYKDGSPDYSIAAGQLAASPLAVSLLRLGFSVGRNTGLAAVRTPDQSIAVVTHFELLPMLNSGLHLMGIAPRPSKSQNQACHRRSYFFMGAIGA